MDQNSSNGAGADKRNWRERLGIGGKDMPKIADEFKSATPPPALKAPQPVAKPAPMAPRATAAKTAAASNSDALAEKLRSQRAAAEKLAEQRVGAARERAEARVTPEAAPVVEPVQPARPQLRPEPSRPKYTFADAEVAESKVEATPQRMPPPMPRPRSASMPQTAPPLVPPRPALGGDRLPPPARIPVAPGQPQYRPPGPGSYRPVDPAASGQVPSPFRAGASPPRSYLPGSIPSGYGDSRYGSERLGQEAYRRGADTGAGLGQERLESDPRLARGMPARPRPSVPAEEYGDVFEDEAPRPRRRASASEYNSAYREVEEGYDDDRRRSSGPWLLLLALLIAAVATFGVVWYYQTHIRNAVATTAAPEDVPIVAAPEQPAKTAAEQPLDSGAINGAASKKQIYDRIVGDREVSGEQIVPTEETPVAPETQQPDALGGEQIPQPAGTAPESDSEPLALPPPPGDSDTQGSIPDASDQQTMAMKTTDTDVVAQPATASGTDTAAEAAPLPEPVEPTAAETEPAPIAPGETIAEPEIPPAEAAAKKTTATAKKTLENDPAGDQAALGSGPVVLVPPAEYVPPASTTGAAQETAAANTAPETKKKKTLFDFLQATNKGGSTETAAAQSATTGADTAESQPDQQVASLPEPAPQQQGSTGATVSGYVVQLASFRTEVEAQTEYTRLKAKYPTIIGGLPPRISQAAVLGSTRYRLGLGPMASRDSASKLCNSLVAAGERDCLVRKQ